MKNNGSAQKGQNTQKKNGANNGMPNAHLHELFVDELRDIMGAERQLIKGLKKMADQAESETLREAFQTHLTETETHIERLREVMQGLGLSGRGKKCRAMEGLLEEAEEIMDEFEGDEASDAALIAAAQKVEHYEIASYGCLVTYAGLMGHEDAERLLSQTLNEEKETDGKLTEIAVNEANLGSGAASSGARAK